MPCNSVKFGYNEHAFDARLADLRLHAERNLFDATKQLARVTNTSAGGMNVNVLLAFSIEVYKPPTLIMKPFYAYHSHYRRASTCNYDAHAA